jgi:peptidoglycan/LPS O-acetylase OafA/YrhL
VLAPLALMFARPRDWMRNSVRGVGLVVVAAFLLALMTDNTYLATDSGHWYPRVHVVAQTVLILAVAISIVALSHIDARDYFRQQYEDASKVWSIESVKQRRAGR